MPMLRACLIAADRLDTPDAIRWIEHWLDWFDERGENEVKGALTSPEAVAAIIEKLYFDGPGTADWVALARIGDHFAPVLGERHVFVPAE